jgi:hypothetical protein
MLKKSFLVVCLLVIGLGLTARCNADDRAAKAQALVKKAVSMAQKDGLKRSLEVINDVKGPLVDGDLYVFAMSLGNMRLAAGSPFNKPKLGTRATADFNKKMAEIAKKKGSGWLEYSWPKPDGSKPVPKRTFIMRVPGEDAYFGCGYYIE